jgi:arylsulfatase
MREQKIQQEDLREDNTDLPFSARMWSVIAVAAIGVACSDAIWNEAWLPFGRQFLPKLAYLMASDIVLSLLISVTIVASCIALRKLLRAPSFGERTAPLAILSGVLLLLVVSSVDALGRGAGPRTVLAQVLFLGSFSWLFAARSGCAGGRGRLRFPRGLALEAGAVLVLTLFALTLYWKNIPAGEVARPIWAGLRVVSAVAVLACGWIVYAGSRAAVLGTSRTVVLWRTAALVVFLGGLSATLTARPATGPSPAVEFDVDQAGESQPNVLLLCIDTLRADHLGCYGYDRPTPVLDRLAAQGALFENAFCQSPWTKPSVASFLTSRYPSECGTGRARTKYLLSEGNEFWRRQMTGVSVAEVFRRAGYETHAVVANPWLSAAGGFNQGFNTFEELWVETPPQAIGVACVAWDWISSIFKEPADSTERVTRSALRLFEMCSEPLFLYVHYFDPHEPYTAPNSPTGLGSHPEVRDHMSASLTAEGKTTLVAEYDEEIAYVDAAVGKMLEGLWSRFPAEEWIVAVVADHGQEFWEHGRHGHGKHPHVEVTHVPFILLGPDLPQARSVIPERVRLIDIVPTILDAARITCSLEFTGISLIPFMNTSSEGEGLDCYSSSGGGDEVRALRAPNITLLLNTVTDSVTGYLPQDAKEQFPMREAELSEFEKEIAQLRQWSERQWRQAENTVDTATFNHDTAQQLRAIGYL